MVWPSTSLIKLSQAARRVGLVQAFCPLLNETRGNTLMSNFAVWPRSCILSGPLS